MQKIISKIGSETKISIFTHMKYIITFLLCLMLGASYANVSPTKPDIPSCGYSYQEDAQMSVVAELNVVSEFAYPYSYGYSYQEVSAEVPDTPQEGEDQDTIRQHASRILEQPVVDIGNKHDSKFLKSNYWQRQQSSKINIRMLSKNKSYNGVLKLPVARTFDC